MPAASESRCHKWPPHHTLDTLPYRNEPAQPEGGRRGRAGQEPTWQQLGVLLVHQVGEVSAVVQDHVERRFVSEVQRLLDAPHVLLVRLALPGVNLKNKSEVTSCLGAVPSGHRRRRRVPGTPVLAMAAAAWSWVEKMLQLDH